MTGPGPFRLYPEEQRWWSFRDYDAVLSALERVPHARVLEFGPGSSTLALIEGGALEVHACEDSAHWAAVQEERLVRRFPSVVHLHRYTWPEGADLSVPGVDDLRFDLALIDGPRATERRPDVLRYALARSQWVLMPTEEYQTRAWLRQSIAEIAEAGGVSAEFNETGPLAGAFALIGPTAFGRRSRCMACDHIHVYVDSCGEHVWPLPGGRSGEESCRCTVPQC